MRPGRPIDSPHPRIRDTIDVAFTNVLRKPVDRREPPRPPRAPRYSSNAGEWHLDLGGVDPLSANEVIDKIFGVFAQRGAAQYLGSGGAGIADRAHAADRNGCYEGPRSRLPGRACVAARLRAPDSRPARGLRRACGRRKARGGRVFLPRRPLRAGGGGADSDATSRPSGISARRADLPSPTIASVETQPQTATAARFRPRRSLRSKRPPSAADAVRLRRYDDIGKIPGPKTPHLEHYRPLLKQVYKLGSYLRLSPIPRHRPP